MADPDYVAARKKDLLDGRKQWSCHSEEWDDPERFNVEVVQPLLELHYEGWFDNYVAPKSSLRGMLYVRSFNIISPVNYMQSGDDEEGT